MKAKFTCGTTKPRVQKRYSPIPYLTIKEQDAELKATTPHDHERTLPFDSFLQLGGGAALRSMNEIKVIMPYGIFLKHRLVVDTYDSGATISAP